MTSQNQRAHGVTPELNRDYARRTANHQAAFVLPYLKPGMSLLDAGCGPGTISLGLARELSPGRVTGLDHDPRHVAMACERAARERIANASFELGNALTLPFEEAVFDAVFENDLLTHLAEQAARAVREVYRVLKPGGLFAARDVDAGAVVWGQGTEVTHQLDRLFIAWHQSRGSDITFGRRLPVILREAGFIELCKSVSADTKGDPEAVRQHAEITVALLDGPFGRAILEHAWADQAAVDRLRQSIQAWGRHPDAFFANIHIEVIGWKPG
jgi:SAM-dependent methyltransferase